MYGPIPHVIIISLLKLIWIILQCDNKIPFRPKPVVWVHNPWFGVNATGNPPQLSLVNFHHIKEVFLLFWVNISIKRLINLLIWRFQSCHFSQIRRSLALSKIVGKDEKRGRNNLTLFWRIFRYNYMFLKVSLLLNYCILLVLLSICGNIDMKVFFSWWSLLSRWMN